MYVAHICDMYTVLPCDVCVVCCSVRGRVVGVVQRGASTAGCCGAKKCTHQKPQRIDGEDVMRRQVKQDAQTRLNSISAKPELTTNVNAIVVFVGDALVADRSVTLGRTRAHAHLPALIVHGGAGVAANGGVGCGAVELVLDEDVV
jgi:hypothetical protein